ncbi:MupG family TIM beta-alpha barrel fold protein [Staphylococcus hyicus]|uniref:MupG family TIM beta-alpha barrel fold protein n=1 Tax=Staphylococcus hyicus TaxID=1284 RepID=UPI000DBE2E75|nr:DUF871 family protein [Staphylococcus hyicus]
MQPHLIYLHNYYPHLETGLSRAFFKNKTRAYVIPIQKRTLMLLSRKHLFTALFTKGYLGIRKPPYLCSHFTNSNGLYR